MAPRWAHSIELFTTVIPLIIIGFSYLSGFAENASPGTLFIRAVGLVYPLTERVRAAFGDSSEFRSSWTFIGVAGFLVWGIPMSITIAGIFAKAWRCEQFGLGQRLLRGATWFVLYLAMIALRERIALGGDHAGAIRALLFVAALAPVWIFWSLTPVLLEVAARPSPVGVDLVHAAVVVIDMQNDFAVPGEMFDGAGIDLGWRTFSW